jgi:hypothetical protein
MILIRHRINDLESLVDTPITMGIEIDVRSNANTLYLSHDPFLPGVSLEQFLEQYSHAFLVLNVKEDGLEDRCLELLSRHNISSYFFLDQSAPTLIRRGLRGSRDGACRYSEFETLQTVSSLSDFCDWVWLDFFHESRVDHAAISSLRALGLKICMVSPELHMMERVKEVSQLVDNLRLSGLMPDAVCTKFPDLWMTT